MDKKTLYLVVRHVGFMIEEDSGNEITWQSWGRRSKFRFQNVLRPHKYGYPAFINLSTLETVFGGEFIQIRVDGRRDRKNKVPLSNLSDKAWTRPKIRRREGIENVKKQWVY